MIKQTILSGVVLLGVAISTAAEKPLTLANVYIQASFSVQDGVCRLEDLSRRDGSDSLRMDSDEFEIVFFDQSRVTADQYAVQDISAAEGVLNVFYTRRAGVSEQAPELIDVTYSMGDGPWIYKDVYLHMKKEQRIDRLQMLRFSTDQKATRGGHGQPVFIGEWFAGINYPCFYSRHSDGFVEPDFNYRWHYTVDLEGGDKEFVPRDGLVSFFHFPGLAKEQADGSWGIQGKQAVIGLAAKKGEGPEFGLLDYIEKVRKPARSYLHFNNWYTTEAKEIDREHFVDDVAAKLKSRLGQYGAKLDAMVPDDGWQRKQDFKQIYESRFDLAEVSQALRELDLDLGVWIAIDGTSTDMQAGENAGYEIANPDSFRAYREKEKYWGKQKYFNILDPEYQADYKAAIRYLMKDSDVRYIKHDFNHMYTRNYISERHSREACLDVTLELIAYERQLNPEVLINYTNGSFFTPFWLLYVEYLWMNSGDHGSNAGMPQISKLEEATSYRDNHFYHSYNNPNRTVRPVLPIANFMTHGILHSTRVRYFDPQVDPIQEWMNYVVMYYGRGTMLKELYLSPDRMTEEMWRALGTASAWARKNQDLMRNTVLVGGDAEKGEVYGYVSWQGDKAMLTVRNPNRRAQLLEVPFDTSVYYRGLENQTFRARAIYPFTEQMPWTLTSGKSFSFEVPGDSVMAFELTKGSALSESVTVPEPLPPVLASHSNENGFSIKLQIPDEVFPHYELLLYHGELGAGRPSAVQINGLAAAPSRRTEKGMIMTACDLRQYRGKTILITGETPDPRERIDEAWLVVDRQVNAADVAEVEGDLLPWAIGQKHRRLTQQIEL